MEAGGCWYAGADCIAQREEEVRAAVFEGSEGRGGARMVGLERGGSVEGGQGGRQKMYWEQWRWVGTVVVRVIEGGVVGDFLTGDVASSPTLGADAFSGDGWGHEVGKLKIEQVSGWGMGEVGVEWSLDTRRTTFCPQHKVSFIHTIGLQARRFLGLC